MDSEIIEKSSKTWYSVIVASSEFGTVQKTTINISFNLSTFSAKTVFILQEFESRHD